jgi:hypothetical protein
MAAVSAHAEQPPFGVTLFPRGSTFRSFAEYEHAVLIDEARAKGETVTSAQIEIRFPAQKLRVLRFAYPWELSRGVVDKRLLREYQMRNDKLHDSPLRRLGVVAPGEHLLAFYLNGVRASNVASVLIDPNFAPEKESALELKTIEPNPLSSRAQLVVIARKQTPFDKEFAEISGAPLWVDGVKRIIQGWVGLGGIGPIARQDFCWFTPNLQNYEPAIDLEKEHTIDFKCGKYVAATFQYDPRANHLNSAWDAMTPEVKDAPSLPISVEGVVRGYRQRCAYLHSGLSRAQSGG